MQYSDDQYNSAQRVHYVTIKILEYLKAQYAHKAMRVRQRLGPREEEAYGNQLYQSICDLLKEWTKKTPPNADGQPVNGLIHIGGVRQDEFRRVCDDDNSRNLFDEAVNDITRNDLPFNRYLRDRRSLDGYTRLINNE